MITPEPRFPAQPAAVRPRCPRRMQQSMQQGRYPNEQPEPEPGPAEPEPGSETRSETRSAAGQRPEARPAAAGSGPPGREARSRALVRKRRSKSKKEGPRRKAGPFLVASIWHGNGCFPGIHRPVKVNKGFKLPLAVERR